MAKAAYSRCLPLDVALFLVAIIIPAQSQNNHPNPAWRALCTSTHVQPNSGCTTIEFEYIGKIDHPVFPFIISSSPEEADWYKQKLFSDTDTIFGHVFIVRESTMKKIAEIPLPTSDMNLANSGDVPRTWPTLWLVLATGHDSKEVVVNAAGSVLLMREIKKWVSGYPPLVERLTDIQRRMNRYLKQSHPL